MRFLIKGAPEIARLAGQARGVPVEVISTLFAGKMALCSATRDFDADIIEWHLHSLTDARLATKTATGAVEQWPGTSAFIDGDVLWYN